LGGAAAHVSFRKTVEWEFVHQKEGVGRGRLKETLRDAGLIVCYSDVGFSDDPGTE
jgi:hypothetical protein